MWPFRNKWKELCEKLDRKNAELSNDWFMVQWVLGIRRNALEQIIALDTPNAAHGVKKAVRIAKEALGHE
jgi:hypothetical protein